MSGNIQLLALPKNHALRQIQEIQSPQKAPTSKILLNQFIKKSKPMKEFEIKVSELYMGPTAKGSHQNSQEQTMNQSETPHNLSPQTVRRQNFNLQPLIIEKQGGRRLSKFHVNSVQNSSRRQSHQFQSFSNNQNFKNSQINQAFKPEPVKVYSAQQIQTKIKELIQSANDDIKDIQISKSSGFLTAELKIKLNEQMRSNLSALLKLEKLSKNPFLHNDFLYNRLMKSSINYYQRTLDKKQETIKDKLEWIECQYYHWLTKLIKLLQYFSSSDVVVMKQEVANVFNWQQNFDKYLEGLKLLEYPTYYKKRRKRSTEIKEIDKMSSGALTQKKERTGRISSSDFSNIQVGQENSSVNSKVNMSATQQVSKMDMSRTDIPQDKEQLYLKPEKKALERIMSPPLSPHHLDGMGKKEKGFTTQPRQQSSKKTTAYLDTHSHFNQINRMLPRIEKKENSQAEVRSEKNKLSTNQFSNQNDSNQLLLPNYRQRKISMPNLSDHSSQIEETDSQQESISQSSSSNLSINVQKRPMDLKKKYLIEAPLSFKMNPPPKIIDLTSDFFEKDTDQVQQLNQTTTSKYNATPQKPQSQKPPPKKRLIINNPKQNAIMVELGKKKIGQLQQFHGKMLSEVLMREFEVLFAPLDEVQDAQEYLDGIKMGGMSAAQQVINQTQGVMPPGMVHDDMMNTTRAADGLLGSGKIAAGGFDFKASGIGMIKRTAQDDYRYHQMNEIHDLKNLLVKNGINMNQKVLQRAILMPEDVVFDQNERAYPTPEINLMHNPFPKQRGKKKKKRRVKPKTVMDNYER